MGNQLALTGSLRKKKIWKRDPAMHSGKREETLPKMKPEKKKERRNETEGKNNNNNNNNNYSGDSHLTWDCTLLELPEGEASMTTYWSSITAT